MTPPITLRCGLRTELAGLAYLRESLKLSVRALVYPRLTTRWLALLNSHPLFGQMLPTCPRLVNKIYRSYFSTRLRCHDRLALLQTHYDIVINTGLAPLVARAARGPVEICRLQGRADDAYRLELRAGGVLCREGELILQLMHGDDLLQAIAFSFIQDGEGGTGETTAIGIGCLQGAPGSGSLERIRNATRELHGMRPKNLLVRMVRQFGHDLGCQHLVLVGNRNRVVTASMRRGKVHADYDGLWEELHAAPRPDGDYRLACEDLPPPQLEEIASKKRSEARKRHEMLLAAIAATRSQVLRSQSAVAPPRLVHTAVAAPHAPNAPAAPLRTHA